MANYILIPEIGMMGAAYARVIAHLIMAVILFLVSQRLYPIRYEWRRIIKLCLIVGGIFALGKIGFIDSSTILKVLLILILPVLLIVFRFFNQDELDAVKCILKDKIPLFRNKI